MRHMNQTLSAMLVPLLLAAIVSTSGCGATGDVGAVNGTVTLDGQPLPNARIQFQPPDGRPSNAMTDAEGKYELLYTPTQNGAEIGEHEVTIRTGGEHRDESGKSTMLPEKLPAKYHKQTDLTAQVEPGDNEINFDLTSK